MVKMVNVDGKNGQNRFFGWGIDWFTKPIPSEGKMVFHTSAAACVSLGGNGKCWWEKIVNIDGKNGLCWW